MHTKTRAGITGSDVFSAHGKNVEAMKDICLRPNKKICFFPVT